MTANAETHFSTGQRTLAYPKGYELHYWHVAKRRVLDRLLRQFEPGAILDLGCGDGLYVRHLRDIGHEAYGVDKGLAQESGFLFDGDLAAIPRPVAASIATVLLSDVLEHVEDQRGFLRSCRDALPALRRAVVTVPARAELWSDYDRFYGHYRRYSLADLESALQGEGIEVEQSGYFFHLLYLPALLLARREARSPGISAPGARSSLLHRVAGWMLAAESRWLPAALPGTSAFAICSVRKR
jgi:SAM-dependent methyltransferase